MPSNLEIVQEKERKRYLMLLRLWEAVGGKEYTWINFDEIARQAGLSEEDGAEIYLYFMNERFFESREFGGPVMLSHRAIVEIEQSLANPNTSTEHFTPTVIQNFNAPVGSVQTGSHSVSIVTQNFGANAAELLDLIRELREGFQQLSLEERREALQAVDALNEEIQSDNPRQGRLKAYLNQIGSFAIKVSAEALVSAITNRVIGTT